jgi:hypothetical protein
MPHVTRTRRLFVGLAIAAAMGVWFTVSRAADEAPGSQSDQVARLMIRIEALEKRITALESRDQFPRQASAVMTPSTPTPLLEPVPKAGSEPTRPAPRVWLLKQSEKK